MSFSVLEYSRATPLLTITVLDVVYTATWAPNPLLITTHVCNISRRVPGKGSTSALNSAKYVGPFSACVETGPSHEHQTL